MKSTFVLATLQNRNQNDQKTNRDDLNLATINKPQNLYVIYLNIHRSDDKCKLVIARCKRVSVTIDQRQTSTSGGP